MRFSKATGETRRARLRVHPPSILAGLLWDKVGRLVPFILSLGLTAVAATLLFFVKETWRPAASGPIPPVT